jgi:hypothetical protein
MPSSTTPPSKPLLVPTLWAEAIIEAAVESRRFPPLMIPLHKLQAYLAETEGVSGLEDLHSVFSELVWRRLNQGKLNKSMEKLKKTIAEVRPEKAGKNSWLRKQMERLKF